MKYLVVTDTNYITIMAEIKDFYIHGGGYGVDYRYASPEVKDLVQNFIMELQNTGDRKGLYYVYH